MADIETLERLSRSAKDTAEEIIELLKGFASDERELILLLTSTKMGAVEAKIVRHHDIPYTSTRFYCPLCHILLTNMKCPNCENIFKKPGG